MDFRKKIRNLAKGKDCILEIGPSYSPILPKKDGFNVFIVDHASQGELIEKYQAYGIDTSNIEPVDFITTDLSELKAQELKFELIIASHVIEHTTDLIKFINDCHSLLSAHGVLALLVPDKRYCFDTFRPITSPGAVITAHHNQQTRHIGGLVDHYSYFTLNNGQMAWGYQSPLALTAIHTTDICKNTLETCLNSTTYQDAHEWVFTPSSFRFLIQELNDYQLINMGVDEHHDTLGFEFFVTLCKEAKSSTETKFEMLSLIRQEELACTRLAQLLREAADLLDLNAPNLEGLAEQLVQRLSQSPPLRLKPPRRWSELAKRLFTS